LQSILPATLASQVLRTPQRRGNSKDLRLLEDLGWADTIDRETVALTVPADELTRTLARLHRDAAGSLGTYVSRPKDDEELAERDLAASEAAGAGPADRHRPRPEPITPGTSDARQHSTAGPCDVARFRR
jgi:hypothetical protein